MAAATFQCGWFGTGCGVFYAAIAMAGWACGGHAGAYAESGKLNPPVMILMGIVVYGLSGAFLGAVAGFVIGSGVWLVRQLVSVGGTSCDLRHDDDVLSASAKHSVSRKPVDKAPIVSVQEAAYAKFAGILIGMLYGASLFMPTLRTPGGYNEAQLGLSEVNYGFAMLLIGLGACLGLNPVWFANVFYGVGTWFFVRRQWTKAGVRGLLAVVCAACGPLLVHGSKNSWLAGYYVWLSASIALLVAGLIGRMRFPAGELLKSPTEDQT